MIYEIYGTKNPSSLQAIDHAMTVACQMLDIPDNVWVDIEFTNDYASNGGCVHCDEEDGYEMFTIDINKKQSIEQIVVTLLHEMKHVEQYATGRLDQDSWLGEAKPVAEYEDLPWEKEAFEFERIATERYNQSAGLAA